MLFRRLVLPLLAAALLVGCDRTQRLPPPKQLSPEEIIRTNLDKVIKGEKYGSEIGQVVGVLEKLAEKDEAKWGPLLKDAEQIYSKAW